MNEQSLTAKNFEVSTRVRFCSDAIQCGGQTLVPDGTKSYVEFRLSHGFPVTTSDRTTLHPNTVRNSYASMLHQVFNLGHIMKAYNPEEYSRDRMLGSVVAVEFSGPHAGTRTGIQVQGDRAKAPGIRAVAVMHKNAEGVDRILGSHQSGRKRWTVSMENMFSMLNSGFLVRDEKQELSGDYPTPDDLLEQGWTYVPCVNAPDKLAECFDDKKCRINSQWGKREVLLMIGGLGSEIHYQGVGLTPLGKEPEAQVSSMMASGWSGADIIDEADRLTPALSPSGEGGEDAEDFTRPLVLMASRLREVLPCAPTLEDVVSPLKNFPAQMAAALSGRNF